MIAAASVFPGPRSEDLSRLMRNVSKRCTRYHLTLVDGQQAECQWFALENGGGQRRVRISGVAGTLADGWMSMADAVRWAECADAAAAVQP